jgi:hypothetical protein
LDKDTGPAVGLVWIIQKGTLALWTCRFEFWLDTDWAQVSLFQVWKFDQLPPSGWSLTPSRSELHSWELTHHPSQRIVSIRLRRGHVSQQEYWTASCILCFSTHRRPDIASGMPVVFHPQDLDLHDVTNAE